MHFGDVVNFLDDVVDYNGFAMSCCLDALLAAVSRLENVKVHKKCW